MIFTSSLTNIFWRETSVLHSKKDSAKLKQLYFSTMKPIYFLSNFIGLIFFINAERLISLILNPEYYSAVPVMQILAFLPAFAAINRINSIFFYLCRRDEAIQKHFNNQYDYWNILYPTY